MKLGRHIVRATKTQAEATRKLTQEQRGSRVFTSRFRFGGHPCWVFVLELRPLDAAHLSACKALAVGVLTRGC